MHTMTPEISESTILARVISAENPTFSPAVANELLKWGFSDDDRERMAVLAKKAREGTLSAEERAECEGYERVSSFLGLVKSRARRSLQGSASR